MRKAILLLLVAGCSSEGVSDEGLPQTEQPYSARTTTNYQFGADGTTARMQCNRTNPAQLCSVPEYKIIGATVSGFTPAQREIVTSTMSSIDSQTSFNLPILQPGGVLPVQTVDFRLQVGACPGGPTNNIDSYSCVQFGLTTPLSEGLNGVKPVGSYQKHSRCVATIDLADILARGANPTEETRLLRHAVGHAVLTCMGLGSRVDAGAAQFYSRRSINLAANLAPLTGGEKCRADSFQPLSNGDFSNSGLCVGVD